MVHLTILDGYEASIGSWSSGGLLCPV